MDKIGIIISNHAYTRLKERNGWGKKTADRMIIRVYLQGKRPSEIKGYLRLWVNKKVSNPLGDVNEFVLYGNMLYLFKDNILLTAITAPSRNTLLKLAS